MSNPPTPWYPPACLRRWYNPDKHWSATLNWIICSCSETSAIPIVQSPDLTRWYVDSVREYCLQRFHQCFRVRARHRLDSPADSVSVLELMTIMQVSFFDLASHYDQPNRDSFYFSFRYFIMTSRHSPIFALTRPRLKVSNTKSNVWQ